MNESPDLKRRSFLLGRFTEARQPAGPPTATIGPSCFARQGIACMSCRDACPTGAVRFELAFGGARPAITADAKSPDILVAGANANIDMAPCNSGTDNTCPFTHGVGVSGFYFSFNGGSNCQQPTYTGYTARNCPDVVGPDPGLERH